MKPGKDYIGVAVFAFILNAQNNVLMVNHKATEKRSAEYEKWWSMPGGSVEFGETLEGALRREVTEEVGLSLDTIEFLNYDDYIKDGQHWLALNFLARTTEYKFKNREPDKIKAIEWFPLADPPGDLSPYAKRCWELVSQKK